MKCREPALFYQELKAAVSEYFSESPGEERRTFRTFLLTLYGIFDILERNSDVPGSVSFTLCLDSLATLVANLQGAVQLGHLIKDYREAIVSGRKSDAVAVLVEMMELVKFCHENLARE